MPKFLIIAAFFVTAPACADVISEPERKPCQKAPVQSGTCGDIDHVGRCEGSTVVWCGPDNTLLAVNCWDAGFEGCSFNGQLYDCYSHQESYQACVERVSDECYAETKSGLCDTSSSPLECQKGEEAAAAQCIDDQIQHGACH